MKVKAYKTHKINVGENLLEILDKYLLKLKNKDIVIITSKIISLSQKRVIKNDGKITKMELAQKESDLYLPDELVKYGVKLTITNNTLIASAGIDESNANGYFVLWPKDPMKEAHKIWTYLRSKHKLKELGIVISDSHGMILRRGLTGFGLSWCGFEPLLNYIGKPDIFGKRMNVSKTNLVDGIAAASVLEMGEGSEQTPIAVVSDIRSIKFLNRPPLDEEIKEMTLTPDEDIYSALLTSVPWNKKRA